VAFAAYSGQGSQNPDHTYIYTAHRDGTQLTQALTTEDFLVFWSWSPDGQQVGYISQTPSNNLAFAVVSPQGGDSEIVDVGSPYYWSWAPTGHSLLVHAGGASPNANARVALLQLDGGVTEQVLNVKPAQFKNPAFSPDGQQVLMAVQNESGGSDLVVTDALGDNARVLTSYTGNIAFAWSPNGKRVAYILMDSAALGTPGQLWVADPAGQAKAVELDDDTPVYAFFWSPDSKSLAYFSEAALDDTTGEDAADAQATATATAADGQTSLLFNLEVMNAGNGSHHHVLTYAPTSQFLQLIPYFEQYHQSLTIWSPDSKNLVISAIYQTDGTPGIFVMAASGHVDPRYIADGWVGVWSWK
jgi:Tol biopolymer transport system component